MQLTPDDMIQWVQLKLRAGTTALVPYDRKARPGWKITHNTNRGSAGANSSNLRENELISQESKSRGAKTCCMTAQGA